jgi:hypothetical protein
VRRVSFWAFQVLKKDRFIESLCFASHRILNVTMFFLRVIRDFRECTHLDRARRFRSWMKVFVVSRILVLRCTCRFQWVRVLVSRRRMW